MSLLLPLKLFSGLLIAALLLTVAAAPEASAHARLLRSNPAREAVVAKTPGQIEFWFSELLEEGFNTVDVYSAAELGAKNHANLAAGNPAVDPADKTHLTVKVKALAPGEYVVDWRVLSRDGHSAPGRMMFKIAADGKQQPVT